MKYYNFICVFIALTVFRNILAEQLPTNVLFDKSELIVKKLDQLNSGPLKDLVEVLSEGKKSCLDLEDTHFKKGHNMIKEYIKKLTAYFQDKNNNVPESRKEKLNELILVRQSDFSKCVGQCVNRAITLINTEIQNTKIISNNNRAVRSKPKKCLDENDSRKCLTELLEELLKLKDNTVQKIFQISNSATESLNDLSGCLKDCSSKIIASFLSETPEIVDAVEADYSSCNTN